MTRMSVITGIIRAGGDSLIHETGQPEGVMKRADVSSVRMLRRARERIDRDYAEPIGMPALAAGAGYWREHRIRAFRAAFGETPGRYRTGRRVEHAHRQEARTTIRSAQKETARRVSEARCGTDAGLSFFPWRIPSRATRWPAVSCAPARPQGSRGRTRSRRADG